MPLIAATSMVTNSWSFVIKTPPMLQIEIARGDQICPEKWVVLEMAAEMCAAQFFDQFAKPLPLADICGVVRVRLPCGYIQH